MGVPQPARPSPVSMRERGPEGILSFCDLKFVVRGKSLRACAGEDICTCAHDGRGLFLPETLTSLPSRDTADHHDTNKKAWLLQVAWQQGSRDPWLLRVNSQISPFPLSRGNRPPGSAGADFYSTPEHGACFATGLPTAGLGVLGAREMGSWEQDRETSPGGTPRPAAGLCQGP